MNPLLHADDFWLDLAPGATLRLPEYARLLLLLQRGRLWLTRCGDPADHFYEAGARAVLDGRRAAVIESIGPGPARLAIRRFSD